MKKSIIALMGLFTLVACSEDSYQEADKLNETGTVDNGSGGMQTNSIDPAIPYESPYDNQMCCSQTNYNLINNTDLDLIIEPYVGIDRYDGADDMHHNGWNLTFANYPNITSFESNEYFKLAKCNPYKLPAFKTYHDTYSGQGPTHGRLFSLVNSTPTSIEEGFLFEYGKLYGLDALIFDSSTNVQVIKSELKFPFLPQGIMDPAQLGSSDWIPFPSSGSNTDDLWYHHSTREICIGNGANGNSTGQISGFNSRRSEEIFNHNGLEYILTIYTTSTDVVIKLDYN